MAVDAVLLVDFRKRVAKHMKDGKTLPAITAMAIGDGGHNPADNSVIAPSETQTALNHEILRKDLRSIVQEDDLSVTGKGTIENAELVGQTISEAALIDANGDLVCVKNFAPKIKENDERYSISLKMKF